MIVLHILNTNYYSGAENVVCQIISMFNHDKDVKMVYCSIDGPISDTLKEKEIEFAPIQKMSVREIKRIIKNYKPDIIHAHDMKASFYASIACGNIPIVSHMHVNCFNSIKSFFKASVLVLSSSKIRHFFWVSQSAYDAFPYKKIISRKSSTLYNIIDVDKAIERCNLDSNSYDYDIIYVGRLSEQKDPIRLIHLCELLSEKKKSIRIGVIGTGEMETLVRKKITEKHLEKNVIMMGFCSNPLKMIKDSKAMIMTSKWEGTPMTALESLALGTPIVSTPVDGMKQIVIDGENGYLSNDDEELVRRLLSIVEDKTLHDSLSRNSVERSIAYNNISKYKVEVEGRYIK